MPNFTIYMKEEVFELMETLRGKENLSRGKYLSKLVVEDAAERGVHPERKALRTGIRW